LPSTGRRLRARARSPVAVAAHYGFRHLDTGLTYRAVAKAMLDAGQPLDDEAAAVEARTDFRYLRHAPRRARGPRNRRGGIQGRRHAGVRRALVERQREFAGIEPGAVLDGRDIGTVVCPDAPVKLFVTASAEVRARRRYHEILGNGGEADLGAILADIVRRDERDAGRADSPLKSGGRRALA
jgi:cytidylate kinase